MEKKQNVPALRFQGFSGEWEKKRLKEMGSSFTYGLNAAATTYDGQHKYLRITDIDDESRKFSGKELTSPNVDLSNISDYKLQKNDIVFARTGASVGKTYLYDTSDGDVYYAGFLIRVKIDSKYDANFIFQKTLSSDYSNFVVVTSQRSGQPGINAQEYAALEMLVPELGEQKKIGKFLANFDKNIFVCGEKIQKLQQFRQAMLTKLFPREGAAEPELRFRGFSGKWESHYLGMLGVMFSGLSGKTKADFGHGKARFVPYLNVFNHPIADLQETEAIEIDDKQNEVKYGDIFFTTSSETPEEVGMSSVWLGNERNVYLNSFCFGYRPTSILYPFFMAFLLRSSSIRKKFIFLAQGISRYNISKNKVMEIEIPVPSFEEQKAIGNFFYRLDTYISLQQKKLERMQRLKAALLDKMFV